MSLTLPEWLLLALACWRLAYMLVWEAGPVDVFETARYILRNTWIGALLTCVYCTSVWTAALLLLIVQHEYGWYVVYWLALSALAICLHRLFVIIGGMAGYGDAKRSD